MGVMKLNFSHLIQIVSLLVLPMGVAHAADFEQDIAPVLEQTCLSCHHAHEKKGGLDLSTREAAFSFEDLILPGNPDQSLLLEVVSGPKPDMPKKGKPLTAGQIIILREWISSGAEWPEGRKLVHNPVRDLDWWSLQPIQSVEAPIHGNLHPVDVFINAKLREKGLVPGLEADPETLIRRLTFDLTGLPPTPEEVEQYLKDQDWVAVVDRLLNAPEFGEKFGQHWLDLVRYAETHGYDKDKPRNQAWPYRDYVIRSFNEDKPYSRFVQEQVAGDELFPDDSDGVIALGFLAAGPWDFIAHFEVGEGKLDGRIAKHLDRDEMVSAVFNVFQSSTIQCAQCHHHKFDPIRMEDYYRLQATFAAVDRADRVYGGLSPELEQRKHQVVARLNSVKAEQQKLKTKIDREVSAKTAGLDRRIAELREKFGTGTQQKPQYGYHSKIAKSPDDEKWVQVDLGRVRAVTRIKLIPAFDKFGGIGAGFGFPVRYRVEVSNDSLFVKDVRLLFDATGNDQPNPKESTIAVDGDGSPFRFVRITATKLRKRKNDYIFAMAELEAWPENGENFAHEATVTAKDSIEAGVRWGKKNLVDGIFFKQVSNPEALAELEELQKKRDHISQSLRTPAAQARLDEITKELGSLQKQLKAFPMGKRVYAASTHFPRQGKFRATEGKPRPIHLLHRGDLRSPGQAMHPGAPPLWSGVKAEFFDQENWAEAEARAELARYLTGQENPLLWRSIANRLWQWTFGAPLVGTPNDFGRVGMLPTHPELLDFLATTLRDNPNHSLKSVLRLLFTSDAYRRSAQGNASNAAIDASNAYLWRANRRRLTAEEYRDSLLAVSGALDRRKGGPSFKDFVIEKPQHSPHYHYHLHNPDNPASHRRSIYRFVVRSQPQPMLTTLDCADPSMSVPQRDESTTALQALTQWNNPFVEAMSRRMASRIREEGGETPLDQIEFAFRSAIGRPPSKSEKALLAQHLMQHGEASFARVLFNLNSFVYVD